MYLSDRDLLWAIECGKLICDPFPDRIDTTSIDLHLDTIESAKVWDIDKFASRERATGRSRPELYIGQYRLGDFGLEYLVQPPNYLESTEQKVGRRADEIIVKHGGFLLWQTKEVVGTNPDKNADLICFVDGKSTKARTGIVVHLTAPTIHTTWNGKITLEIANFGPFDIVLKPNDVIAQLIVAKVSSPPSKDVTSTSATYGQSSVAGRAGVTTQTVTDGTF